LILGGLYLLSYRTLNDHPPTMMVLAWLFGAGAIIVAVLQSPTAVRVLDNKIGAALGFLSFPIYLVHGPVLWSAASFIYVRYDHTLAAACVATIVLTLLFSWPLGIIDRLWVRCLNSVAPTPIRSKTLALRLVEGRRIRCGGRTAIPMNFSYPFEAAGWQANVTPGPAPFAACAIAAWHASRLGSGTLKTCPLGVEMIRT